MTIKPCTTVVLDLNLDVQLYSLVIMQQARYTGDIREIKGRYSTARVRASVMVRLGFGQGSVRGEN